MKHFYLLLILSFFLFNTNAQINQAVKNNGKWNNASSWSLGHLPENGEVVIIPEDSTLIVDNNMTLTTDITLKVFGNLDFQVGKLRLTTNSVVLLYPGATITSEQGTSADKIEIGGVSKYVGSTGTLTGPLMASSSTTGFGSFFVILPVKFIAYNIAATNTGVSIKWSAAEETDIESYVIERSEDGNNWRAIASMPVITVSAVNNYAYEDKTEMPGLVYYRVKGIEKSGQFVFTSIKSIKANALSGVQIKILSNGNSLVIELTSQIKGNVAVRVINFSGAVMTQQNFSQPSGYMLLNKGSLKGNYIISISNGQDINVSKQILL